MATEPILKTCARCKLRISVGLFSSRKEATDGYHYWCRSCNTAYVRGVRGRAALAKHRARETASKATNVTEDKLDKR